VGEVIAGRFELIDSLGLGGTGSVWRAWDRRRGRYCAAKVMRQRDAAGWIRIVREQAVRLDHPHLLCPYGWVVDDDTVLLAMDLVAGGSVATLINDYGPLPERYAAELLAQLLTALGRVHEAGLVHRDVKPSNLMLEATGTAAPVLRLGDFGIALPLGGPRLTREGSFVGTPGYVPAEMLAGADPGVRQDLYAAGAVGWQLLTGLECPAAGPAPDPTPPPGVSIELWDLIRALLGLAGTLPIDSARSALEALRPLLATPLRLPATTVDGEPIEVFDQVGATAEQPTGRPTGRPTVRTPVLAPADPPAARRRSRIVLAAAAVAALLVGGAATAWATLSTGGGPAPAVAPAGSPSASTTPGTASPVATASATASATAGQQCSWQQEGDTVTTTSSSTVRCTAGTDGYRWRTVG
jgi:serine/threonine-protein kinase